MKNYTFYTLILCFFLFETQLQAASFSSLATGNWNTSSTWTLVSGTDVDGIPDADDIVTVALNHTITLDIAPTITSLIMSNGTLIGANGLAILNDMTLSNGIFRPDGVVSVGGIFNWQGGTLGVSTSPSVFDIIVGGVANLSSAAKTLVKRTLILNGGGTWSAGDIAMLSDCVFRIPVGQKLTVSGSTTLNLTSSGSGTRLFDILGELEKTTTNSLIVQTIVNCTGKLNVLAGLLDFNAGGTLNGIVSFAASSTLKITGGVLNIVQDMAMDGKVLISNALATLTLSGAEVFGALEMLGGTLNLGVHVECAGSKRIPE